MSRQPNTFPQSSERSPRSERRSSGFKTRVAAALLATVAVTGVGAQKANATSNSAPHAADKAAATMQHTVTHLDRHLIETFTPNTDRPRAILIVLAGLHLSAREERKETNAVAIGQRLNLDVISPSGVNGSWNAGRCCGAARDAHVDDVAFLDTLIHDAEERDGVHRGGKLVKNIPVFIEGFSTGSAMAAEEGAHNPLVTADILIASGLQNPKYKTLPKNVLFFHGNEDTTVPEAGGQTNLANFLPDSFTMKAALGPHPRMVRDTTSPTGMTIKQYVSTSGHEVTEINGSWAHEITDGSNGTANMPLTAEQFIERHISGR